MAQAAAEMGFWALSQYEGRLRRAGQGPSGLVVPAGSKHSAISYISPLTLKTGHKMH